ncbi:MAG: sugar phosphate isomerase/epimerase [Lachnospiraceae bacterium]|nr:sugar phosphate isomerase/epimerase [Lachnospiraceae bacterium]
MKKIYSLVHLTDIHCPPPDFIRAAAQAGYDAVSLRTIPLGLPGESRFDIAADRALLRETRRAMEETGLYVNDVENARIAEGLDVRAHEPGLCAAAELGVKHIQCNVYSGEPGFYTEQLARLCELADTYGQTVEVEFVAWAKVADLAQALQMIRAAGRPDAGIVVDALHYSRSRVRFEEIEALPKTMFRIVHLCDAGAEIPTDRAGLIHTGRDARLYPGEGAIDFAPVLAGLPEAVRGVEVPNLVRLKQLGLVEHARRALESARRQDSPA